MLNKKMNKSRKTTNKMMLIFHTMYNGFYIYNPGQNLSTQIEILSHFHCYENFPFLPSALAKCCLISY